MIRTSDSVPSSRSASRPRRRHSALAFSLLWIVSACAATGPARDAPAPPPGGYAKTIFVNGTVVTVVPEQPEARALAVATDGTILAVGDESSVRTYELKGTTEVVDLNHKILMPGFVEPHTHAVMTAFNANNPMVVNLSSFDRTPMSSAEIQKRLSAALQQSPIKELTDKGGWLLAFGVDPSRTEPFMDSLDKEKLDQVSTAVPIFVVNQSGHFGYVNSKAIELAGIEHADDPPGGVYEREGGKRDGALTGVLQEAPAYKPFQVLVGASPSGKWFDRERQLDALKETYNQFAAAGVTTATEMSLGLVTGNIANEYDLLRRMVTRTPGTPVRLRAYVSASVVTEKQPLTITPNNQTGDLDLLKVIGVKFVADGSTQGLTASLRNTYDYPNLTENAGTLNYPNSGCAENDPACICKSNASLYDAAEGFVNGGWQLAIHSNGDCSTYQVLEVYEKLLGAKPDRNARDAFAARRFRIEHLTVTGDDQLTKIAALGLTPSMTNGHVYFWGYAFGNGTTHILGWPRAQRIDPASSLLRLHVPFSFNSDAPITPVAPLRYISTAVTRLWQHPPTTTLPDEAVNERIAVDDAIRAVTLDAAYQLFLDKEIGSLKAGKRADLVILDKNPRTTSAKDIMDIRVLATYLGGARKYSAPAPEYGSLQNDASTEYRCSRAAELQETYTASDCLMKFVRRENGAYTVQNVKNRQYFQSAIGTMADSADSDEQEWDIVGTNGRYTIQNRSNHQYMTSTASQLSATAGPNEYWTIETRLNP